MSTLNSNGFGGNALIKTPQSPVPMEISPKSAQLKEQVDQVVNIMQANLEQVMDRGDTVQSLENRTGIVNESSVQFRRNTAAVRRKLWWKNCKLNFLICLTLATVIVLLIFTFALPKGNSKSIPPPGPTPPDNETPGGGGEGITNPKPEPEPKPEDPIDQTPPPN